MLLLAHILSMAGAFLLLAAGVFVAMFRRNMPDWLKLHKTMNSSGMALALAGFFFVVLGISLVQGEHFTIPHTWVGLAVISSLLIAVLLGQLMFAVGAQAVKLRPWHVWWGRATVILMIVNIILGVSLIF